ncbi:MAG: ElyC/SanA/YdcF family protein [Myxococcota bacterium]|jgi:SanA protein|nr:ElyC/SanA/YdcF family protein [Myxococcota bacterium]
MEGFVSVLLAILASALVFGAVIALAWRYANHRIEAAARGHCFEDASAVPSRATGLVLGCTRLLRSGRPNRYFAYRIDAAASLFHSGRVERLLVSGASHRGEVDEAFSMKEALIEQDVPEERIVCDHHGYRTIDSVLRAPLVFDCDQLIVVSQRFHVERALYVAKHRGIDAIGFAARDVSRPGGRLVRLREIFARIRALVDVHLTRTGPRTLERTPRDG